MRSLKYLALLAVLLIPAAYSHAQVAVGVGVGPGYGYGPPACAYGYYDYAPYACAPYGFYGPEWFAGGLFIGAGPVVPWRVLPRRLRLWRRIRVWPRIRLWTARGVCVRTRGLRR